MSSVWANAVDGPGVVPPTILAVSAPEPPAGDPGGAPGRRRRLLLIGGGTSALAAAASVAASAAVRRRLAARRAADLEGASRDLTLGWGDIEPPEHRELRTRDGALLAVWDLPGDTPGAATAVLPHCWGCSHEIWLPVARRLHAEGHRVVLYDQRGHGASTRGTAPLSADTLAHDLALVLEALDVRDAVLAGHSMGGMTIMALAGQHSEVLHERARATVLVATAATGIGTRSAQGTQASRALMASALTTRALRTRNGHVLVRSVFGIEPERAHLDLTRRLFADCDATVRGDLWASFADLDLRAGIATMRLPTTVMVGSRDGLTLPAKAEQIASGVPGARLVTLPDRGHMLPLEDPDAVVVEIVAAAGADDPDPVSG